MKSPFRPDGMLLMNLNETWLNYIKWAMKKLGLFKGIEGIMLPSYLEIMIYHGSYLWWTVGGRPWRLTVDIQATRMVYGSRDLVHVQDLQFGPVARSIFWMRLWMRWADFYLEAFFLFGVGGAGGEQIMGIWLRRRARWGFRTFIPSMCKMWVWNMSLSVISNETLRPSLAGSRVFLWF